ncbi:MAG: hypothetical protein JKY45_03265 [Emcibacter sp.]|nr:hypothetical protein [Emcibacter sp.]
MNIRISSVVTANEAWGGEAPDWVIALAECCDLHQSQNKAAQIIGYSNTTVSQVLMNKYPTDYTQVEKMIRGALLKETAICPVFGLLNLKDCNDYQTGKRFTSGSMARLFRKNCPTCDFNRENKNGNK